MPPLSRWFVRTGFLALGLSVLLELALADDSGSLDVVGASIHRAALHLFTVGWLLQLIAGVAFWMFPRHPTRPPRGPEWLGWTAFGLLNSGLLLRTVTEPWQTRGGPGWPLAASAALQFAGVLALTLLLWPRIQRR